MTESSAHFKQLLAIADDEIKHTLAGLPPILKTKADALPILCEAKPSAAVQADNILPDTLGLFVGEPYPDAYAGAHNLPAQIILYLENIWEYANHDEEFYREEITRTLLHELGHYLGLDEDDLADRDLD